MVILILCILCFFGFFVLGILGLDFFGFGYYFFPAGKLEQNSHLNKKWRKIAYRYDLDEREQLQTVEDYKLQLKNSGAKFTWLIIQTILVCEVDDPDYRQKYKGNSLGLSTPISYIEGKSFIQHSGFSQEICHLNNKQKLLALQNFIWPN